VNQVNRERRIESCSSTIHSQFDHSLEGCSYSETSQHRSHALAPSNLALYLILVSPTSSSSTSLLEPSDMADTPMSDSNALSNALPAIPLPALPPISSPAPLASSSSATPQPQPQPVHIPAPSSAADSENGPPKRKRVRRSEGQPGPGKSWRKGLKGLVARSTPRSHLVQY